MIEKPMITISEYPNDNVTERRVPSSLKLGIEALSG